MPVTALPTPFSTTPANSSSAYPIVGETPLRSTQAYPYPATPEISPTPLLPTPTIEVQKPSTFLDVTSPESIVHWIAYALGHEDISVFESLARASLYYGPAESDALITISKQELLEAIKARLPSHPICMAYNFQQGEISEMRILTSEWEPIWEPSDLKSSGLIFNLSDQWTKGRGFFISGVAIPQARHEVVVDQFYAFNPAAQPCIQPTRLRLVVPAP